MDNTRIGLVGKANNTSKRLSFLNGGNLQDTVSNALDIVGIKPTNSNL